MPSNYLFENIQILEGSSSYLKEGAVLISKGVIKAFGGKALKEGKRLGLQPQKAQHKLLAPCLVDPHSFLESPFNGKEENIETIITKAKFAGYGQLGILPRGKLWRDQIDLIFPLKALKSEVILHLWGGFSIEGKGTSLSRHYDLLRNGAIGLADDDFMPPTELLSQGFLLGEMGKAPVLIAPRDKSLQAKGISRHSVETLRAGWAPDPVESEILPLSQILELNKQYPEIAIRLMNISTSKGVSMISKAKIKPMASVFWWHLVKDNSTLSPHDIGWSVIPSIGSPKDKDSLIKGLENNILKAISVHSTPLDDTETTKPATQRKKGISGFDLVLPLLWNELVKKSGWKVEKLWEKISFGPSHMLAQTEEHLQIGSNRWLLFDPTKEWTQPHFTIHTTKATNQPLQGQKILGKVLDCGLINKDDPSGLLAKSAT